MSFEHGCNDGEPNDDRGTGANCVHNDSSRQDTRNLAVDSIHFSEIELFVKVETIGSAGA